MNGLMSFSPIRRTVAFSTVVLVLLSCVGSAAAGGVTPVPKGAAAKAKVAKAPPAKAGAAAVKAKAVAKGKAAKAAKAKAAARAKAAKTAKAKAAARAKAAKAAKPAKAKAAAKAKPGKAKANAKAKAKAAVKVVRAKGVVFAIPGARRVEVVGADHQAHLVTARRPVTSIRPGAVIRYGVRANASQPVKITRLGQVKQTFVIGVVVHGVVRLADGTKLNGANVTAGVAALRAHSGLKTKPVNVRVNLHFAGGRTRVGAITATLDSTGKKVRVPKKVTVVSTPTVVAAPAVAAGPWWKPSSASPLALHWMIDGALGAGDPIQMGLQALDGTTLAAPAVFDIDGESNTPAVVDALHAAGAKVICYVDAGTLEAWRSDASAFPAGISGSGVTGWQGETWLDIRRIADLAPIMQARFAACKAKGFDAVEPDNVDGYSNSTGFPLTAADQLAYNRALAGWAHSIGLSIGLKNDLEQASALVGDFDWALNEECYDFGECGSLKAFSQAGKAVWIAEYKSVSADQCGDSLANHFNTAQYALALGKTTGRQPCAVSW
jgi:hypothetical protein